MAESPTKPQSAPKKKNFWEAQTMAKERSVVKNSKKKRIKYEELAMFTQQLSSMLEAGLPIVSSLEALQEQINDPVFRLIIKNVRKDVSGGSLFSTALKKYPNAFPNIFISMVEAGEASGALPEIMGKISEYFDQSSRLTKKVKSALTYPVLVIAVSIIVVAVLLLFVIPIFEEMFASFDTELPKPTQFIIALSEFLKSYIIYLIIGLVFAYQFLMRYLKTDKGGRVKDKVLFRTPFIGKLIQQVEVARFTRTYAILTRSGVPILRSLAICSDASGNSFVDDACVSMIKHVNQGGQVSEVIARTPYFPPVVYHMSKAGEASGNTETMMLRVSAYFDNEVNNAVAAMSSLIEPFLIIFIGLIIGGIVVCMFLPIFKLSEIIPS